MDQFDLLILEQGTIVSDDVGHLFMRIEEREGENGGVVNFVCQCGEFWSAAGVIEETGGEDSSSVLTVCKVTN